jgi:sugar phosphate isomerase/epimerase
MFQNLNAAGLGLKADIEEAVGLAKAVGFKGVDLDPGAAQSYGPSKLKDLLAQRGLLIGGCSLPVDHRGDEQNFKDALADLPRSAAIAREVGCTRFATWMPSGSNDYPYAQNFDRMRSRLREIASVLRDYGCRLGVEFIGPKTFRAQFKHEFIWNLPGMIELSRAVGAPNIGLLLDSWHWYTSGGDLAQIANLRAEQVVYVHVNDAPAGIDREQQVDKVRALPMETGVIDLPGFLKALNHIGYDGPVTPEPFAPQLGEMAPLDAAKLVAQGMQKAWRAAGLQW